MEYTLLDTYEGLKDSRMEIVEEIEELINAVSNNDIRALNRSTTLEEVRMKRLRLSACLMEQVLEEEPKDYPLPKMTYLYDDAVNELEKDVLKSQQVLDNLNSYLASIRDDIKYLQKKKTGFERMKEAYLDASKLATEASLPMERVTLKRLFNSVKQDLYATVDTLFPGDNEFKEFLAKVTSAYTTGGDNVYVDVTAENLPFVNFLLEADIITWHRNDRNKVKMIDML